MNTSGSSGYGGDSLDNTAHGSARLMSASEADAAELFAYHPARGSILLARSIAGTPAFLNQQGHVLLIAPARSGKGGVVIGNLVTYQGGSMVVTDPRAENSAVAGRFREWLGQKVIYLDPDGKLASYGISPPFETHCYDPLHASLCGNDEGQILDDIPLLADALLVDKAGEREQHWRDGARQVIISGMTFTAFYKPERERTIITLARVVNGLDMPLEKVCQALVFNKHPNAATRDVISRMGAWWDNVNPKERASFVSMALRSLAWVNSPRWADHLSHSDVHSSELNNGNVSVFIICPFEKLETYAPWFRVVLTSFIIAVLRGPRRSRVPTLFLLDEYPALGRLAIIEQSIPFFEGAGGRFLFVAQSLDSIQALMPENRFHGLIANAGAQVFFNVSDQNTADYVSKFMGNYSAMTPGPGGMNFVARPLLTPDEVRLLPATDTLVFLRGYRPARLEKINLLQDQPFRNMIDKGLLAPNPVHAIQPPAPKAIPTQQPVLLSIEDAIPDAHDAANLNLRSVTAALEDKYPDKQLRLQGHFLGYDEPWTNPDTGLIEMVFQPVIHTTLLRTLVEGGSSDYA